MERFAYMKKITYEFIKEENRTGNKFKIYLMWLINTYKINNSPLIDEILS